MKIKKERIYFLTLGLTLTTVYFRSPAVTFQDWSSYNLTFDRIRLFFLCHTSIYPLSTRLLGVHARLLLEHSAKGSLGYWWLIRHFALVIYIVVECRRIIVDKSKLLKLKLKRFYWLIGRRSNLNMKSKIMLFKAKLKPVWIYGIQRCLMLQFQTKSQSDIWAWLWTEEWHGNGTS